MEIHAPDEPVQSWKHLLIHLGIVTAGILIALSLEGLVEWSHHRHLIREARENIRSEIEDNKRELDTEVAAIPTMQKDRQNVVKWLEQKASERTTSKDSLRLNFQMAELSRSSWTTAQMTGALGLMSYAEVKQATEVYNLQEEFLRVQTRADDASFAAMPFFVADLSKASEGESMAAKKVVRDGMVALELERQVGAALSKRYAEYLANR